MNDDTGSANKHHTKSKFLSKDRWRGKKTPNESGEPSQEYQLNADVVDFLKPSANKLRPVSPRAPRIDIAAAQRRSGHNPGLKSGNVVHTPSSLREPTASMSPESVSLSIHDNAVYNQDDYVAITSGDNMVGVYNMYCDAGLS